jgi:hypothetical protein
MQTDNQAKILETGRKTNFSAIFDNAAILKTRNDNFYFFLSYFKALINQTTAKTKIKMFFLDSVVFVKKLFCLVFCPFFENITSKKVQDGVRFLSENPCLRIGIWLYIKVLRDVSYEFRLRMANSSFIFVIVLLENFTKKSHIPNNRNCHLGMALFCMNSS